MAEVESDAEATVELEAKAGSPNGTPPGVPIRPRSERVADPEEVVAAAGAPVCVKCMVVRAAVLLVLSAALIYMLVQERRKAGKPAEEAKP